MTFSQIRQYIKGVLSNILNKTLSNIAPKFNPTETYSIGDRVIYNGDLYRFTSAHTGSWAAADASKTNVNAYLNSNSMVACGGGYAPIGTVISYMGTRAPSDFLICDGTVYNIADYTELADFFELQFGSSNFFGGDGNTTFAVPDLRGEFLRGTGTNSHTNQGSGANVGVHQDGTEHMEVYSYNNGSIGIFGQSGYSAKINEDSQIPYDSVNQSVGTGNNGPSTQGRYTSRPTNTSVLYCIKAKSQGNGYSLDEQIVGTWIDGKPIYQKTIECGKLPNNSTLSKDISALNISMCIRMDGFCFNSAANRFRPLQLADTDGANVIRVDVGDNMLNLYTRSDWSTYTAIITLQYTKTDLKEVKNNG